jgi:hypothetical protein
MVFGAASALVCLAIVTEWIAPYVACGRRVSYQARDEGRTPYKVLSIPLHALSAVHSRRSLVPTNNNPQSATNTFGAWLSSKLDRLAYIFAPFLPESHTACPTCAA